MPFGLPKANTVSPWRTCEYDASGSAGSFAPSTLISARSSTLIRPAIRAEITFIFGDSAEASEAKTPAAEEGEQPA
jgi:hypothetical protein